MTSTRKVVTEIVLNKNKVVSNNYSILIDENYKNVVEKIINDTDYEEYVHLKNIIDSDPHGVNEAFIRKEDIIIIRPLSIYHN